MIYEIDSFQDLLEMMASCERLGLPFTVTKRFEEVDKWFKKVTVPMYTLTTTQKIEGGSDNA